MRMLGWCLLAVLLCGAARADGGRSIRQYIHTSWTSREGAPRGVKAMAQGADGFLWIGSDEGLFRFDGLSFERYVAPDGTPLPEAITAVVVNPANGDLWFASWGGDVGVLRHGQMHVFAPAMRKAGAGVWHVGIDGTGVVWAATNKGLWRLEGDDFKRIDESWGFSSSGANYLYTGKDGTMWAATNGDVWTLKKGARRFEPLGKNYGQTGEIGPGPDGRMWIAEATASVHPMAAASGQADPDVKVAVGAPRFFFQSDGSLWIATMGDGVVRVAEPGALTGSVKVGDAQVEAFGAKDGLSGDVARAILRDREGNLWVGTQRGVDRFRPSAAVPIPLAREPHGATLTAGDDGGMWLTMTTYLYKVDRRGATFTNPMGEWVLAGARDRVGDNWWFGAIWTYRMSHGVLTQYAPPPDITDIYNGALYAWADETNTMWVWTGSGTVAYLKDGVWHTVETPDEVRQATPVDILGDRAGNGWFSYAGGDVYRMHAGVFTKVLTEAVRPVGRVRSMAEYEGRVWIAGEDGLGWLDGNTVRLVRVKDLGILKTARRLRVTGDGMWLADDAGAAHVDAGEVAKALADSKYGLDFQQHGQEDGIPGPRNTAVGTSADGVLWYMANDGLAWIDPKHVEGNPVAPQLAIVSVASGGKIYRSNAVDLPARSTSIEGYFSALSFSNPEKVRVRYRLDGVDKDWRDAGLRREVAYNNLGPGRYRFRVIAANESGVWSDGEASVTIGIAAAWYQTIWFYGFCAVAVALLLAGLVRVRVWQIRQAMRVRFDDRLAERMRVARQIHDTLLQTVQGSKMIADDALDPGADEARMRTALTKLSGWLAQATTEGREALRSLRVSSVETNHLADSLRHAADSIPGAGNAAVEVGVSGEMKEFHPIVRDEIFQIAFEAIRNAVQHSGARSIRVEIVYGGDFVLTVKDDGVGIGEDVMQAGRAGHFGLTGMRERAARIRGKVTIANRVGGGAEVGLVVPGSIAYRVKGLEF